MLRILDSGMPLCDGITRREWLRVGGLGLGGFSLAGLAGRSRATDRQVPAGRSFGRAKSIIVFGLTGGPPQHETWDPKPDAPAEIRGEFGTIASRTPGLRVGELMPRTAGLTDKFAVLRAVATGDNAHSTSGYAMLTGVPHVPRNAESSTARAPNFSPSMGALVRYLRPAPGQLPSSITLPEHIWNDGNFPWPGQDAGHLGHRHNPWLIHCDPSSPDFQVPALTLADDVASPRLRARQTLARQVENHLGWLERAAGPEEFAVHSRQAFELLNATASRQAFEIGREPDRIRDRYGRSRFAQSVLLARRLVEAGVSLVQVNWTRIANQPNQGGWDTHNTHNAALKNLLMPMMDQAFSALIEDLEIRGMLDETLVVWWGEFGRTPRFNGNAGRDHWGNVFSLALAGGGIRCGVVHGASDRHAAYPASGQVEPCDILATLFHCLGHHPDTTIHDSLGRPLPLMRGSPIEAILA